MKSNLISSRVRFVLIVLYLFVLPKALFAQFIISEPTLFDELSLHPYASYWHAGAKEVPFEKIQSLPEEAFISYPDEVNDFGFTQDQFWIRFEIQNATTEKLTYFLETSRPITDLITLYIVHPDGTIEKSQSGDIVPFKDRAFAHRKSIFKIQLEPESSYLYFISLKSDGEVINGSIYLRTDENLHSTSAFEQIVFGFFYGILLIAAILYLFFFFAMRERSFLYYSLYVIFIGLLQFSLDGYFYQFFTPEAGWLSNRAVILSATIANFLLGRYAQVFLKVNQYSKFMQYGFYTVFTLDFLLLLALIIFPSALYYSYPIANVLGLAILFLIISSIVVIYRKTGKIDGFFATGIFFLVAGFVIFILKNFSVLPVSFWTENSSKLGTGLEVIFLSLSMANLIKRLRDEREELKDLALQKSEEMNELKSYFLSNISHELRTPLNAILSMTDAIKTENKDDETQRNTEVIKYSAVGLLNSVNDILDFSKIEKNELQLEKAPFSLMATLKPILYQAELQAKDKQLGFHVTYGEHLPEHCIGDAARIAQVLQNVLSNAIKFTEHGFIRVELKPEFLNDNKVNIILSVADTGVGIPKEKMKSIFDSFSQESINNKRKFGGLGLGLYIVKSLVDLFGGSIDMQSLTGQGTVCTISIPLECTPKQKLEVNPTTVQSSETYDLNGKRILVVEDNAMNQMVIKMITKKWLNTQVVFTNNGLEGLNALKESHFDVVLMDLQMPVMDGYEATIAIRNGEAGTEKSNIPIIAVTADVMETTKTRVKEIGMNHYLSKPVDKEVLFQSVKRVLANELVN